jgi:hypothetical protein
VSSLSAFRDTIVVLLTFLRILLGKIATALNIDASELIENAPDENQAK